MLVSGVGDRGVLMAVPDSGCGGRGGDSHGSPRSCLWRGEAGFLLAVPGTGCGGERQRCSWQSHMLMERGGFNSVPDACCGGGERWGSHGSPRCLL